MTVWLRVVGGGDGSNSDARDDVDEEDEEDEENASSESSYWGVSWWYGVCGFDNGTRSVS